MDVNWNFVSSFFLSLLLHGVLIVLLVFSVDTSVRIAPKVTPQVNIVKAVSVDKNQVEKELNRFKEIEKEKVAKELKKQQKLERKLRDLEKLAAKAQKSRKAEEKKLAEVKKKKTVEQKKREEEQNKLSQLKKEKAEIEKKQKEDGERKRKEEAERKKRDEIKQKEEQERQRKREQEQRLQQELAEEQLLLEAEQLSRVSTLGISHRTKSPSGSSGSTKNQLGGGNSMSCWKNGLVNSAPSNPSVCVSARAESIGLQDRITIVNACANRMATSFLQKTR